MYGRVLARDDRGERPTIAVRTDHGDVDIDIDANGSATGVRPGDWVHIEGARVSIVQCYRGDDFPGPDTETARMTLARRASLCTRARGMTALRQFFAERAFVEVDTPLLVPAPGLEVHLDAVPVGPGGYLITSPEFQMKRLLCAGFPRIYTVCKSFRANERGHLHSSEFTMLEWYRAFVGIEHILRDTETLVASLCVAVRGTSSIAMVDDRGAQRTIDVTPPWIQMTVADAWRAHAGIELDGDEDADALRTKVRRAGIDIGTATRWDDVFYTVFVDRVEPALAAMDRPVVLVDWPARLPALARRKPDDPRWVERFEVYIGGVELCNAYGELTDPVEQRARCAADLAARDTRGLSSYPLDERFLSALDEGLPPCAGIALGVDRLFMLLTGSRHIRDVLTFTSDEL